MKTCNIDHHHPHEHVDVFTWDELDGKLPLLLPLSLYIQTLEVSLTPS